MTDNLKPCPFCGTSIVDINVDGGYRWCECGNNDCRASAKAFWFLRDAGNADHIVANNWNTRPIEDALRAQLAEAEADADRLAKELHDWLVYAEVNDQIYYARSGINAILHHQKRKEGK